jgi:DNA-binding PadR family transcriptional regulator
MPAPSPLGEFEVTILMAVLHLGDAATGAAVLDEIQRRTDRATGRGAVYVTLDRLEQKGLVASRMDQAAPERGGHPRRFFKATALGLKRVRHAVAMLDKMRAGLEPILEQP